MVTNTPKRHQKYAMPKFECRPRPLWSSIAHAVVTIAARPNRTWMPTPARKSGLVDGIGMPKSTVFSGGIGFHSASYMVRALPGRFRGLDDRDDIGNIP